MSSELIDTQGGVDQVCRQLSAGDVIGVDTEFLRVRTYFPQLALVQVSTSDAVYCFDPLADGVHFEPLWAVLTDPGIVKVMHAARQDVEVLLHTADVVPAPLFDTQVAAGLLGYAEQIGYAGLVREELGEALPKTSQRTDWTRRPLSEVQLGYARNDVRHLLPLRERLGTRLESLGRDAWALEDCRRLLDRDLYRLDPEQAWRRVGAGAHLKPRAQHDLKRLCAWREHAARQRDLPRSWVVDDNTLAAIAAARPPDLAALGRMEGMRPEVVRRDGAEILACIEQAPDTGAAPLPWSRSEPLDDGQKALKTALVAALKARAAELGVAESLLITRAELTRLARGASVPEVVGGWRREVIGGTLEAALAEAS